MPRVPIEAAFQPARVHICLQNSTVEVFPFVPVIPMTTFGCLL